VSKIWGVLGSGCMMINAVRCADAVMIAWTCKRVSSLPNQCVCALRILHPRSLISEFSRCGDQDAAFWPRVYLNL
jgi:hypothetical protein